MPPFDRPHCPQRTRYSNPLSVQRVVVPPNTPPPHLLFNRFKFKPDSIETIAPVRRRSNFKPALSTTILDPDTALITAFYAAQQYKIRVYTDGSSRNGGVGAAATLYIGDSPRKTIHYHLGAASNHTVYEAEAVALVLGLHLLTLQTRRLHKVLLGLDNQAMIQALDNQKSKPSHCLLDKIHGPPSARGRQDQH
jgi:hypothetical protein